MHKGKVNDELIMSNLGLVGSVCKKYLWTNIEYEDLFQVGCVGLIKAINNFDKSRDLEFSTYAVPMISGELKKLHRKNSLINVHRNLKARITNKVIRHMRLEKMLDREPSEIELANELGISIQELKELNRVDNDINLRYLDEVVYKDTKTVLHLHDVVKSKENVESDCIDKLHIEQMLKGLNDRERLVVELRYFENKTQGYVSDILGISQVQVSRLEKKALHKMRDWLNR